MQNVNEVFEHARRMSNCQHNGWRLHAVLLPGWFLVCTQRAAGRRTDLVKAPGGGGKPRRWARSNVSRHVVLLDVFPDASHPFANLAIVVDDLNGAEVLDHLETQLVLDPQP
jgi:hypothetical protein